MKRTILSIALCLVLTITIHYLGPKGETLQATANTVSVLPAGVFGFPEGFESINEWSLFIPMDRVLRVEDSDPFANRTTPDLVPDVSPEEDPGRQYSF
jgi:hypothetical protein